MIHLLSCCFYIRMQKEIKYDNIQYKIYINLRCLGLEYMPRSSVLAELLVLIIIVTYAYVIPQTCFLSAKTLVISLIMIHSEGRF